MKRAIGKRPVVESTSRAKFAFYGTARGVVGIVDAGGNSGNMTVTNDADAVVAFLLRRGMTTAHDRIVYQDTEGMWDELRHDGTRFVGFGPLRVKTFEEAVDLVGSLRPGERRHRTAPGRTAGHERVSLAGPATPLGMIHEAVVAWPQFDTEHEEVNGGDLVEWFAEWRERAKACAPSELDREVLLAVISALAVPRNRFGKLDPIDHQGSGDALRRHAVRLGVPHGGLDRIDQAVMVLQRLIGEEPVSILEGGKS